MTRNSKLANEFVQAVASLEFENTFNPYTDVCDDYDLPDAPEIRRSNLYRMVKAALDSQVRTIWIARDLGYRGGRRTGLALTDEAHLHSHSSLYGIASFAKSTRGPVVAERTANVIWGMLNLIRQPVFLWNVFPLHPHEAGVPLSNRCHTRAERLASKHIMVGLMKILEPDVVLTIGRDAESALFDMGFPARCVRHPSYGGQAEFMEGIREQYGLARATGVSQAPNLF